MKTKIKVPAKEIEKLEKLAEEAWCKYRDANPPRGQAQFYYTDNKEYWKAGYVESRINTQRETDGTHDFYSVRFERLKELLKGSAFEKEFFNIMANGTANANEPPSYSITLNLLKNELALKQSEITNLKEENNLLKDGLLKTDEGCLDPVWLEKQNMTLHKNLDAKDEEIRELRKTSPSANMALKIGALKDKLSAAREELDKSKHCSSCGESWISGSKADEFFKLDWVTQMQRQLASVRADLKQVREIGVEMQRAVNRKLSAEIEGLRAERKSLSLALSTISKESAQYYALHLEAVEECMKFQNDIAIKQAEIDWKDKEISELIQVLQNIKPALEAFYQFAGSDYEIELSREAMSEIKKIRKLK